MTGIGRPHPTQSVGLFLAVALVAAGSLLSPPWIDPDVRLVLAVFLATVILWITKPVPYAVSSLLAVVALYAIGPAETFPQAASGFASNLVVFMVLLLLIGKSVASVGLDGWIAGRLVSASNTPRESVPRISGAILLLAFVLPSGVARTVTFTPIIDAIGEGFGVEDDGGFNRLLYYVIGHLNPIASMALMTGGGMAIATAEMISTGVRPITWVEWALYMTPPVVVLFVLLTVVGTVLYDVDDHSLVDGARLGTDGGADARSGAVGADPTELEAAGSPPLDREQRIVVATLFVAIALWVVGSVLGIPTIVPAALVVAVFALPGVGIVTAESFGEISWGIVFLIGAMLSILEVMEAVDAFDPVVGALAVGLPMGAPTAVTVGILLSAAVVVRVAFSSVSASFIVLFPIVLEFGRLLGVESLYLAFALAMVLMTATALPFNNPTVLIAYERGPLTVREVFALGMVTLAAGFLVAGVSWAVYWPAVDLLVESISVGT